jgi:hypothetical protein
MTYQASIEKAADVLAISACMSSAPVGGTVTYEQLSAAIGRPVQGHRYLVQAAISKLSRDTGAIFVSVYRVGYKRIPAEESHILGAAVRETVRRRVKRAGQKIIRAIATANDMPADAARRANREVAILGLIEHASSDKALKAAVTEADTPKPVAKVMADMLAAMR